MSGTSATKVRTGFILEKGPPEKTTYACILNGMLDWSDDIGQVLILSRVIDAKRMGQVCDDYDRIVLLGWRE